MSRKIWIAFGVIVVAIIIGLVAYFWGKLLILAAYYPLVTIIFLILILVLIFLFAAIFTMTK